MLKAWRSAIRIVLAETFRPTTKAGAAFDFSDAAGVMLRWASIPISGGIALLIQDMKPGVKNLYDWAFPLIVANSVLTILVFRAAVSLQVQRGYQRLRLRELVNRGIAERVWAISKKWLRKSEQGDKWNRCLIEGMIVPRRQEREMSRRPRRNHSAEFKAKVVGQALAAVRGDRTLSELASQFDVHPNQITQWKTQLLDRAAQLFGAGTGQAEKPVDMKVLHAKIGELALENDFLESALTKAGLPGARR